MTPGDFESDLPGPSQELGSRMDSIESIPPNGAPREDLITKATSFLLNPKVNQDSQLDQRAFLQRKGLTPVEIDMAFQRRMALLSAPAALAGLMGTPRRNGSWADFFHRMAMGVAVLGSASYALYWFFKTYVEPRLQTENRTEKIMTEILEEIRKKKDSESDCALQTMRAIAELRQEMAALKKMLVARNQFPSPPTLTGVAVKIPSWQQIHQTSTASSDGANTSSPRSEEESPEKDRVPKSIEIEESAPDSGISPEATSSDGEPQAKDVKDKPRNPKKKRGGHP